MTRHTIEVTQGDIDRAMTKNSSRCVVATAIARSIPSATRISVDVQSIRFTVAGERFAYLTPYAVSGYVVAFDAGDDIHPFRFRLDEAHAVAVRQTKRTDAGKATQQARDKASRKRKALDSQQQRLAGMTDPTLPPPSPVEITAARAELNRRKAEADSAEQARDAVVAAYAGQAKAKDDVTKRKAPPGVFKRNQRHYGHRLLRVNQDV